MDDTPEKKPQLTPSSLLDTFEDSPVFNYISNLSPIKLFNFSHTGQSFPLLSFTSPQYLQTSPEINIARESKISSATQDPGVTKNKCSENNSDSRADGISDGGQPANVRVKEADNYVSVADGSVEATEGSDELLIELPKSLKYDSGSPVNCTVVKTECEFDAAGTEITPLKVIQGIPKEAVCSLNNEMEMQGNPMGQNKEVCDWEKFVYEASDILNFRSPAKDNCHVELGDKSVDPGTISCVGTVLQLTDENTEEGQKLRSESFSSENHDLRAHVSDTEVKEQNQTKTNEITEEAAVTTRSLTAEEVVHFSKDDLDNKTTRRRCLIYEMSGSNYRKLLSDTTEVSPNTNQSASPKASNEKRLVPSRPGGNKFSSSLPSIGLHLNAIAASTRKKIIVNRQTLACRRQLISSPCTISPVDSLMSDLRPLESPITSGILGSSHAEQNNNDRVAGKGCQSSSYGEGLAFHLRSPKKKRQKSDNAGETESCKRCNCKRSKCLKLYCECFAAGLYCVGPCNCQDCFNKPINEEIVLETRRQIESRNPLAFAPKVIRTLCNPQNGVELKKTPASARHKRGCNCKRSGCLKKYCECFQGGVGCSPSCRCEGCQNTFGRKEGTEIILFEQARILGERAAENIEQGTQDSSPCTRQLVRRSFHFRGMIPKFPMLTAGQTFQRCTTKNFNDSNETSFKEDLKMASEKEVPEMLKGDDLLSTSVKSTSPNCKRVSPPHCEFESSPAWRSSRKLILRSIPSFPPLSPENQSMNPG